LRDSLLGSRACGPVRHGSKGSSNRSFDRSPSSPRSPKSRLDVSDLPDLTERLKEQGIHGKYIEWRDQYMRWRKGEAKGAKGENTAVDHEKRTTDFEHWYPTVKTFTLRRTIAFWAAVLCAEGCLLFLWIPYFQTYGGREDLLYQLTKLPNFFGGSMFLIGIYMSYFELINMNSNVDERLNFLWCDWQALLDLGIEVCSVIGSMTYLIGALLYTTGQVSEVLQIDDSFRPGLIDWPYTLGGFLFFLGGVCELQINRVWCTWPTRFVWWASLLNALGGVCFWLSSCPSVMDGDMATLTGVVGTAYYLVAAVIALLMWRGEQFGGSIIPALNKAQRGTAGSSILVRKDPKTGVCHIVAAHAIGSDAHERLQDFLNPKLSWRGLIFLNVYVVIGAVQIVACCLCVPLETRAWSMPFRFMRILNTFVTGVGNIAIVHMILVLNSACVTMPKEEPYHTLMVMMRVLALVFLANSLLTLHVLFES